METIAYPGSVTLLALLLYLLTMMNVGRNRGKHGIEAPATTGNIDFECAYRTQMNTLEHMFFFLPSMWLFAYTVSAEWACWLGLIWVAGRTQYAISYITEPKKRAPGLIIAMITQVTLFVGAAIGVGKLFLS
ncbi:MAG: MAPEG family protein [Alphaproteobacteria bacterium]|nr:MAPEG family protein [Alphaproteobacteria bacterium]